MDRYAHIIRAVGERPWAIYPGTLASIVAILTDRANGVVYTADEIRERIEAADRGPRKGARRAGTVGVVPIYGTLAPRVEAMNASGGTSVDQVSASFRAALEDPEVDGILLDIDSPGGVVDGIPELAGEIRAARERKPIVAIANTFAASAAYWLGSAADELVATQSAKVGSIGAFTVHEDLSAKLENDGIRPTMISAGKYKTEGNPFGPLSEEALAYRQAEVDEVYAMMTADIAKSRGVSAAIVRGEDYGEGRVLSAKRALDAGMIDRIETFNQAASRLASGKVRRHSEGQIAAGSFYVIGDRGDETFLPAPVGALLSGTTTSEPIETVEPRALPVSGIPYAERLAAVLAEAEAVVAHTEDRRAMRLAEGRDLSEATRNQCRALSEALAVLAEPLAIAPVGTNARTTALRIATLRAELEAAS